MATYSAKAQELENSWYLVDAKNQTLGRLASHLAIRLRGKHKAVYTPHLDAGDYIVVINADQIQVTGNKAQDKIYHHSTGYVGHLKSISFEKLMIKHPTAAIEKAVKGMLPKGPLGRQMFKKLKIYAGGEHPHQAQQPQPLSFEE